MGDLEDRWKEYYERYQSGTKKYDSSEMYKKQLDRILKAQIGQQKLIQQTQRHMNTRKYEEFRKTHPDLDRYVNGMIRLIEKYPFLDTPDALELIYKIVKSDILKDEGETLDEILGLENNNG